jgi:two-component system, NarL family, response regulator LiaR
VDGYGRVVPGPLSVIVADDDPFARRAVIEALRRDGVEVPAEAHDGEEAVALSLEHHPDVLLMDVVMPGLDGIAATVRIVAERPDQVVVLLTSSVDDELGMLGLRAGAAGFLTKDLRLETLARTLQGARAGEAVVSRRFGMLLVEHLRRTWHPREVRPVKGPLTPREWEVMALIAEHRTTDEIAEALVLSPETVRSHVKHILRKLDVRSREQAIEIAQRLREADPPKPAA